MTRRLVLIESPFSAETPEEFERNQRYLKACFIDACFRGESPYASHAIFPQFLHDAEPKERAYGITCGYDIGHVFATVRDRLPMEPWQVFYTDLGMSDGMADALDEFEGLLHVEIRQLGADWETRLAGRDVMNHIKVASPAAPSEDEQTFEQALSEVVKLVDTLPTDESLGKAVRKLLG